MKGAKAGRRRVVEMAGRRGARVIGERGEGKRREEGGKRGRGNGVLWDAHAIRDVSGAISAGR